MIASRRTGRSDGRVVSPTRCGFTSGALGALGRPAGSDTATEAPTISAMTRSETLTRTLPIVKLSSGPTLAVINGALGSSVSLLRPFLGNVPDPAYFGDFCVWSGIWLIAVSTGHAR